MKKILLLAMTLFFAAPNMQAKENEDSVKIVLVKEDNSDSYYYEGVVPVEGVSKEEMYKRAKEWVLSTFKTNDNNAQFDEKELLIYTNPIIILEKYKKWPNDYIDFKVKLMFKDGKYKFRFDNLIAKTDGFADQPPRPYNGVKMWPGTKYDQSFISRTNAAFLNISKQLEEAIKRGNKGAW